MDIQYLLWLQEFRGNINDVLTPAMEWISMAAVSYLIMLPVFVYWCADKKKGLFTLAAYYLGGVLNDLIKLTACVYRPWIRDSRVIPAGDSVTTSTGYSFPSGHTICAATLGGGLAVTAHRAGKRAIAAICILFILLTAFSRNYLGVHTPQDVIAAILEGILCLYVVNRLFLFLEKHPEKEDIFLLAGVLLCGAALAYTTLKGYPADFGEDGKLIVDPSKIRTDGFNNIGRMLGFIAGRFIEKRWIRFRPAGITPKGIALCTAGLVIFQLLPVYVRPLFYTVMGKGWGKPVFCAFQSVYLIALFPLLIKLFGKRAQS